MRLLICGSRGWTDESVISERLIELGTCRGWDHTIVHGDSPKGADRIAGGCAAILGFWVEAHPADWKRRGRSAGYIRNVEMLDSGIDEVIAFWDGQSRGTQHTIDEARKRGIPVEVVTA